MAQHIISSKHFVTSSSVSRQGVKLHISMKQVCMMLVMACTARAYVFASVNPFVAAGFAAGLASGGSGFVLMLGVVLGNLIQLDLERFMVTTLSCAVLWILDIYVLKKYSVTILWRLGAVCLAALVPLLTGPDSIYEYIMIGVSAMLTMVIMPIISTGFSVSARMRALNDEELFTLVVLAGLVVLGLSGISFGAIELNKVAMVFIVLICSGAGAGAAAACGAIVGLMVLMMGGNAYVLGLLCTIGIVTGSVRGVGRIISCIVAIMANAMLALLISRSAYTIMAYENIIIASALYIVMPNKVAGWLDKRLHTREKRQDSLAHAEFLAKHAEARVRVMANSFADVAGTGKLTNSKNSASANEKYREYCEISRLLTKAADELHYLDEVDQDMSRIIERELDKVGLFELNVVVSRGNRAIVRITNCNSKADEHVNVNLLSTIITKAMGMPMEILPRQVDGERMDCLTFIQCMEFDMAVGISRLSGKLDAPCGDSYMVKDIEDGNVVLALSDGMGSGMEAAGESSIVMRLLGNFLQAGYDRNTALDLVNRLSLQREKGDMYATVDMCCVDLVTGKMVMDKLGATFSLLKRDKRCFVITGASLPMGVVDSVAHKSSNILGQDGDILIMITDGIADGANSSEQEWLIKLVEETEVTGAQELADAVMRAAIKRKVGSARDDMTVLTAQLYKRNKK